MADSKKPKKSKKNDKVKSTKTKSAKKASAVAKAAATKTGATKPAALKPAATKTKPKTTRKGKAPANAGAKPVIVVTHDQIANKAYGIWLAKGKPRGQDEQNWLEAKAALESV